MKALYAGSGTDDRAPTDRPVAQIDPVPRVSIQAFCESPDLAAIVSAAISDRRMAKAHVKLNMGGAPAAVEAYRSAPTPNVVVLEAPAGRDALVGQLEELAQYCDAGTKVVVLGKLNDIVLYRQLIARGVSEYLVAPFGVVDFVQAMSQLFTVAGAKPLGRVIAVVGAKGGVGASTVAHNLAWSLASVTKMATIIADFDLAFGTAGLDYNQDPPQGVAEAVFAPERVDAVLVDRLLSKCSDHLSLLAAPATLDRVLDFAEASFDSLIDAMRASTPWVVVDVPHLWSGWARRILVSADEVVVIASPDLANLRNAKNLIDNVKNARLNDAPAAARPERGRHAQAAGNRRCRLRQGGRDRSDRGHPARCEAVRRGGQQRADDRRSRTERKNRRGLRRSRLDACRADGSPQAEARRPRAADRQARAQAPMTGFPIRRAVALERSSARKGI
jgi:pilus assembly protein CpaE